MDELVIIRTFSSSMDLQMVKAYLESMGIECFVRDETVNRAYLANVNGGAKLLVENSKADEAIKLLIDGGYLTPKDFEPPTELKWAEKFIEFFKKK